jgi:hypothetical protein
MSPKAQFASSVGTAFSSCAHHYHYWFHTGEAHAIRQMLGHRDLPQFVGDMAAAVYRPEKLAVHAVPARSQPE